MFNPAVQASKPISSSNLQNPILRRSASACADVAQQLAEALPSQALEHHRMIPAGLPSPMSMQVADLKSAHALSQAEQWPHRLVDWGDAMALGDGVVLRSADDRVVGTGMVWKWGDRYATLGLVIVDKACRGLGLGKMLMHDLLQRVDGRDVLLHATEAGLPVYEKFGFRALGRIAQHQGLVMPPEVKLPEGSCVVAATPEDAPGILNLDLRAKGASRKSLIDQLMRKGEVLVLKQDQLLTGFVVVRDFGRGKVLGPVVAPDLEAAKALIARGLALVAQSKNSFARLDVPVGSGLEDWLISLNLKHVGGGVVMVKGALPKTDASMKAWSLVSQSLG